MGRELTHINADIVCLQEASHATHKDLVLSDYDVRYRWITIWLIVCVCRAAVRG